MKAYLVDANAILRYLLDDILSQADIVESHLLRASKGEIELSVPLLVVGELVYVLTKFYNWPKEDAVDKLSAICEIPYLDIEKRNVVMGALSIYRKENLSFVDALLVADARVDRKKLLTFDRKLKKLML